MAGLTPCHMCRRHVDSREVECPWCRADLWKDRRSATAQDITSADANMMLAYGAPAFEPIPSGPWEPDE
jgi:hypothetical protein